MQALMLSPEDNKQTAKHDTKCEAILTEAFESTAVYNPETCGLCCHHGAEHHGAEMAKDAGVGDNNYVNDTIEEQIRRRQEAREKAEAERRRVVAERELAKDGKGAATNGRGDGSDKKSQRKGKGRKYKK